MTTANPELLRRYVTERSEQVFAQLVERHIDLVYSTAVRLVNGDTATAEDVTQAVFTDLARKAPALVRHKSLAGWLYTSTRYAARHAVRAEQRRRQREEKAYAMNALLQETAADTEWDGLRPVIDEALNELKPADRDPVLMRFFEHRTLGEIGARLGLTENAARMRVERALERLREALRRRGITSTAAALTVLLSEKLVVAAPAGLAPRVSHSAFQAAGSGGLALALAWLAAFKTPLLVAGTAACLLLAAAIRYSAFTPTDQRSHAKVVSAQAAVAPTDTNTPASADPLPSAAPLATAETDTTNRLVLKFVADDSGRPIPNVVVSMWSWEKKDVKGHKPRQANRSGVCEIPLSRATLSRLVLVTKSDGFADTRVQWSPEHGETIPNAYTVRIRRAVFLGGTVVDADNQPVPGAEIGFNNDPGAALDAKSPQTDNFSWPFWVTATSDAQGCWKIERIAPETVRTLYGSARHPDYVMSEMVWANTDPAALELLRKGTYVFKLRSGAVARGIVVDAEGAPIGEAKVLAGRMGSSDSRKGKTRLDGTFELAGCTPGELMLTAEAPGFAPTSTNVDLKADSPPVRLTLQPGRLLRLRVVNAAGEPIPKAGVYLDTFDRGIPTKGRRSAPPQANFNRQTDAAGRLEWVGAPNDELSFNIRATGYMEQSGIKVWPDGQEHIITLPPAFTISGKVTDATTGQPIPKFRIIAGWPQDDPISRTMRPQWSSIDRFWLTFSGGTFRHAFEEPVISGTAKREFVLRFEADGYAPFISQVFGPEQSDAVLEVKLNPAASHEITVLLPNGQPAREAEVACLAPGARVVLAPGGLSRSPGSSTQTILLADKQGRCQLPPEEGVTGLIAAHPEGFAEMASAELADDALVRLQPWGRIEGVYLVGGKPVPGQELRFQLGPDARRSAVAVDSRAFCTKTDADGRFAFPQVPPGQHRLVRLVEESFGSLDRKSWREDLLQLVEIRAAETTQVNLKGGRYTVLARLVWPSGFTRDPSWKAIVVLQPVGAGLPRPLTASNTQIVPGKPSLASSAGLRPSMLKEGPDGKFTGEGIPPGEYTLAASVLAPPIGSGPVTIHAGGQTAVTVPDDGPFGEVDLGELRLQALP